MCLLHMISGCFNNFRLNELRTGGLVFLALVVSLAIHAQVEDPFEVRFQTQEKGGIALLSNISVSCNSGSEV